MLSVIIPTYNPDKTRLQRTLNALYAQTLHADLFEVIIIDNNSVNETLENCVINENTFIVKEPNQGLTFARLKGFTEARGEIIVMVDDDNELDPDFLQNAVSLFTVNPAWGAIGGKIEAEIDGQPDPWALQYLGKLAVRDLGNEILVSDFHLKEYFSKPLTYPLFAPVGAGMCLRKSAISAYIDFIKNAGSSITDRKGDSLSSSGDNDIVLHIIKQGYEVVYHPELKMKHLLSVKRFSRDYLARLNYGIMYSWVKLLNTHGILPWKPIHRSTLMLRKSKAYLVKKAWLLPENYVEWKGVCGMFDALAEIKN